MLSESKRNKLLASLDQNTSAYLRFHWPFWARPKQLPPTGKWQIWLLCTGRGFGKTRSAAEWCRNKAFSMPGSRGAIVAATPASARDVCVEGESGIIPQSPPWFCPTYEPSKRELRWPNGTIAKLYSAFEPGHLRGPQHHWAWAEELCTWKKLPRQARTTSANVDNPWHMLMLGLRLGDNPQVIVTTTPKPVPLLIALMEDPDTVTVGGSSYENMDNLAPPYVKKILSAYEGTSLEQQEIFGVLLSESERALWSRETIDKNRAPWHPDMDKRHPEFTRVVIPVDPSGGGDEIGILAVARSEDFHGYVLEDSSMHGRPEAWASAVVKLYDKYDADYVVGERNFGGDMVESVIQAAAERAGRRIGFKNVTASRGKRIRAQPISLLYEKGVVHHVGMFEQLEAEMCTWEEGDLSPNRMDALVHGLTDCLLDGPYHENDFDGVSFG